MQGQGDVTDQGFSGQLETAIDTRPSTTANSIARDPIVDPIIWPSTFNSIPALYELDQSGLGALGVNWISPQYHEDLNWDALLDGIGVNSHSQYLVTEQTGNGTPSNQIADTPQPQGSILSELALSTPGENNVVDHTESSPSEGRYYVDGHGARAPFGGRIHDPTAAIQVPQGASSQDFDSPMSESSNNASEVCYPEAYDNLIRAASLENERQQLGLDIAGFPSHSQVQLYVRHYFAKFHPIFPFIRQASFKKGHVLEWILLLAVAVVGSRYVQCSQSTNSGQVMLRLLTATLQNSKYGSNSEWRNVNEEVIFVPGKRANTDASRRICILQAGILNIVCLLHSGKEYSVRRALTERHYLVEACHSLGLMSQSTSNAQGFTAHETIENTDQWLLRETKIRLGMMIWVCQSFLQRSCC